jgi:hypothetical protein
LVRVSYVVAGVSTRRNASAIRAAVAAHVHTKLQDRQLWHA